MDKFNIKLKNAVTARRVWLYESSSSSSQSNMMKSQIKKN